MALEMTLAVAEARVRELEGALQTIKDMNLQWADGLDPNIERIRVITTSILDKPNIS